MNRLAGKSAFITAAGAGIGRAIALAFAREGAVVTATDIDSDALARLQAEAPSITTARLDVRDAAALVAALSGPAPDVLCNCAGFVHQGNLLELSDADWDFTWDLNVTAMMRAIRAVLPGMIARGSGNIINIASVASSIRAWPNRCAYGVTKAAVIGLTKSVAADFAASGIRANAICPGPIETPSLAQRMAAQPDPAAVRARFLANQPTGRLGRAEEVAALAVYLASDEAAFTTGQTHIIDGGLIG
jgi:2-keto-3-deoxy-L-fuconate dehydrogenase